jgi:hypothetical protein
MSNSTAAPRSPLSEDELANLEIFVKSVSPGPQDRFAHLCRLIKEVRWCRKFHQPALPASVVQPWVHTLSLMKQSVLLAGIRGPDGVNKTHPIKAVVRALRRAVLLSAFDRRALDPYEPGGGSFAGPCTHPDGLVGVMHAVVQDHDELPLHYLMHVLHCAQILGYHHPDPAQGRCWLEFYEALVESFHLDTEDFDHFTKRLGDHEQDWLATHPTLNGKHIYNV